MQKIKIATFLPIKKREISLFYQEFRIFKCKNGIMSSLFYNSYDFSFIYQRLFFQNEGKQIANRVNDSNRPKSMAMEIIILVYADMSAQLQVAPN